MVQFTCYIVFTHTYTSTTSRSTRMREKQTKNCKSPQWQWINRTKNWDTLSLAKQVKKNREKMLCRVVFMWIYFHWFVYSVSSQFVAYKSPNNSEHFQKNPQRSWSTNTFDRWEWSVRQFVSCIYELCVCVRACEFVCMPFDVNRWIYNSTTTTNWRAKYRWRHIHRFEENKSRLEPCSSFWSALLTFRQQQHSSSSSIRRSSHM